MADVPIERQDLRIVPVVQHVTSLRLSRKAAPGAIAPILAQAGLIVPAAPCTYSGTAARLCAWLEPRAWLVLDETLAALGSTDAVMATDVSARSVVFEISGRRARDVIAAGCDPALVAPGRVARTRFASLCNALIVQLEPERYRVLVDVSIAATFAGWLRVTAEASSW